MNARDLIDSVRETWVADSELSPTRAIVYKRDSDDVEVSMNVFSQGTDFNKAEKDSLGDYSIFSGLNLSQKPQVNDTVTINGDTYKVKRYVLLGSLYTVYCEKSKHNGMPRR